MFCMHAVSCLGCPGPEQIFAVLCLDRPFLGIALGVTNMEGEPVAFAQNVITHRLKGFETQRIIRKTFTAGLQNWLLLWSQVTDIKSIGDSIRYASYLSE